MIHDSRVVARTVVYKRAIDHWRPRCTSARDVRGTVLHTRAITRPVVEMRAIDDPRTLDAVARHRSLDWSLDRIRHCGIVVHGGAISCALGRPLHHIGHDGVITILV
jgi:hypothetical protein